MILDILAAHPKVRPERVLIDHVEEHTIKPALDAGFWVGMTLYPITKCTPERAVDMIELCGTERIMANSAGDWGPSNPMAMPDFIRSLRARGHDPTTIQKLVYGNPLRFFKQAKRFNFCPTVQIEK